MIFMITYPKGTWDMVLASMGKPSDGNFSYRLFGFKLVDVLTFHRHTLGDAPITIGVDSDFLRWLVDNGWRTTS